MSKALILVDLQNDFCPGGALAVNNGHEVVSVANLLMVEGNFDVVVATQDWHPTGHKSFASSHGVEAMTMGELNGLPQVMWPDHCVFGTEGAEFHKLFISNKPNAIIRKGKNKEVDSYSGFFDNWAMDGEEKKRNPTGLTGYLNDLGVKQVYIMGLALDYCVKWTALDAQELGFETFVIEDGCRAVNLNPEDGAKALAELKEAGVKITTKDQARK